MADTIVAKAPQDLCRHDPCWCGRGESARPQGYKPYSKKRAAQWLKERQQARGAAK